MVVGGGDITTPGESALLTPSAVGWFRLPADPTEATIELEADELLFEQGTRGNRVYFIESGCLDIVRPGSDGHQPDASELAERRPPNDHDRTRFYHRWCRW